MGGGWQDWSIGRRWQVGHGFWTRNWSGCGSKLRSLERELDETPDYGLGRGAPFVTRWGLDQALLQQLKEKVSRMEQALMSGASERYGVCGSCGQPIHPDRLAVLPDTDLCVACAKSGFAGR